MAKTYTLMDLTKLSPEQRKQLYVNAAKHRDGQYIIDLIDQHGLALSSGGLTLDDPTYRTIVETVWSIEGRNAAVGATKEGIPALCGVDRLLQEKLGDAYSKHDLGTASAGAVVADLMRHLGYKEDGSGACPKGCTAKSGIKWR